MGRATKPTAYVEAEASLPAVSLNSGKKSAGKMSAAAVPYRKKSYHSIAVPIKLATATWRIEDVCPSCSPPTLSTRASFACLSPMRTPALQSPLCTEYYSIPGTRRNPPKYACQHCPLVRGGNEKRRGRIEIQPRLLFCENL